MTHAALATPAKLIWSKPVVTLRPTYKQFLARSMRLQAQYIRSERTRMHKLNTLRLRLDGPLDVCDRHPAAYKLAAAKLGLHPLTEAEIDARFCELTGMEARIHETHGDRAGQRAIFELMYA